MSMTTGAAGATGTAAASEAYKTYARDDVKKSEKANSNYGKTVGDPKLSEEGQKYYEQLKKKFGNMDFVLVSKDQKANAQANAAKYANPAKQVVLIDEEKIEKMATDEAFRKKYEGIISNSSSEMAKFKESIQNTGANVKGFGMQINDGGTTSFFAVLQKSSDDQKARIEKKAETKRAEKKAEAKKAEKKAEAKRAEEKRSEKRAEKDRLEETKGSRTGKTDNEVTITASSMEELIQKIQDHQMAGRADMIETESETMLGRSVDFRG